MTTCSLNLRVANWKSSGEGLSVNNAKVRTGARKSVQVDSSRVHSCRLVVPIYESKERFNTEKHKN